MGPGAPPVNAFSSTFGKELGSSLKGLLGSSDFGTSVTHSRSPGVMCMGVVGQTDM